MDRFGYQPVKVEGARTLGLTATPCVEVADLSPARIGLLRITLNRLDEKGMEVPFTEADKIAPKT